VQQSSVEEEERKGNSAGSWGGKGRGLTWKEMAHASRLSEAGLRRVVTTGAPSILLTTACDAARGLAPDVLIRAITAGQLHLHLN